MDLQSSSPYSKENITTTRCLITQKSAVLNCSIPHDVHGFYFDTKRFNFIKKNYKKRLINIVMSVYLSTWDNSAPSGHIIMKFDLWVFFENLFREFKFDWIW
jgi:hypothetical protein